MKAMPLKLATPKDLGKFSETYEVEYSFVENGFTRNGKEIWCATNKNAHATIEKVFRNKNRNKKVLKITYQ